MNWKSFGMEILPRCRVSVKFCTLSFILRKVITAITSNICINGDFEITIKKLVVEFKNLFLESDFFKL